MSVFVSDFDTCRPAVQIQAGKFSGARKVDFAAPPSISETLRLKEHRVIPSRGVMPRAVYHSAEAFIVGGGG